MQQKAQHGTKYVIILSITLYFQFYNNFRVKDYYVTFDVTKHLDFNFKGNKPSILSEVQE